MYFLVCNTERSSVCSVLQIYPHSCLSQTLHQVKNSSINSSLGVVGSLSVPCLSESPSLTKTSNIRSSLGEVGRLPLSFVSVNMFETFVQLKYSCMKIVSKFMFTDLQIPSNDVDVTCSSTSQVIFAISTLLYVL